MHPQQHSQGRSTVNFLEYYLCRRPKRSPNLPYRFPPESEELTLGKTTVPGFDRQQPVSRYIPLQESIDFGAGLIPFPAGGFIWRDRLRVGEFDFTLAINAFVDLAFVTIRYFGKEKYCNRANIPIERLFTNGNYKHQRADSTKTQATKLRNLPPSLFAHDKIKRESFSIKARHY